MFFFVLLSITWCPFWVGGRLGEEEKAGCFAVVVLQVCCCWGCSVALLRDALGWSAVCDCGIS